MIIRILTVFIACSGILYIQACGGNPESETEKDYKRKAEADRVYKERYMFDVKSEKAACDKATEVAHQEYQIKIESCSWNGSVMELSLSRAGHEYQKALRVKSDHSQDYRLVADVNDNEVAKFLGAMTQIIRHASGYI